MQTLQISADWLDFAGLFVLMCGFVIGLGATTIIDIHGYLGRKSSYWTEATIRTHKVTKPLIWLGIILVTIGTILFYRSGHTSSFVLLQAVLIVVLIINGTFLSFVVSPFLLKQEKEGRSDQLLPASLQKKIAVSLVVSAIGWWGSLALFSYYLVQDAG